MPKVVFVTGGSSGIGACIASELAKDPGYRVYASSRNATHGEVRDGIIFAGMDVCSSTSVEEAFKFILQAEKRIDVLINNAGVGFAGPLEETTVENMHETFCTNLYGILETCRQAAPIMRSQRAGTIVNISSIGGRVALPFRGVYSASKFALEGMTESLSMELKQFGVKVIIVEPGTFRTRITENRKITEFSPDSVYKGQFMATYDQINKELERAPTPEEFARKVKSILERRSPALRYVIAKPSQKLSIRLKAILPSRLFEKLIMNHFKIPQS